MNQIIRVAIHDLRRLGDGFQIKLGKEKLAITGTMQRVIDELYKLYSRRTSKSHGKFAANEDNYPTQRHLRDYVKIGDFAELTAKMMETLKMQAGHRAAASGGHVFFAHFEREARQYLLVAIINEKLGTALTSDLDVQDIRHLDMDGFRFAGRINITGWANNEERYIGFLKGKGSVSEYFKEFLGCDTTVQDRQDTADLVRALKSFADRTRTAGRDKIEFLSKAKAICDRAARNREEIEFGALANELMPRDPETLLEALTDPEAKLNDRFVPDRRALASLVKFRGRTSHWSVEFEREAITGGRVTYNEDDNSLTLNDLPDDLAAQLQSELAAHDK